LCIFLQDQPALRATYEQQRLRDEPLQIVAQALGQRFEAVRLEAAAARRWHAWPVGLAGRCTRAAARLDEHGWAGLADCLREPRGLAGGAWRSAATGNRRAPGYGRETCAADSPPRSGTS